MSTNFITCPSCGSGMPAANRFCPNCGHLNEAATASSGGQAQTGNPSSSGTPTTNIGRVAGAEVPESQNTRYFPQAQNEPAPWQPGEYGSQAGAPAANYSQQAGWVDPYNSQSSQPSQQAVQTYGTTTPAGMGYQYQSQVGVAGVARRDPTIALVLELIGYILFLGIGHIYAGRITRGVMLMVGYWAYWGIAAALAITVVGVPIACLMALVHPFAPIISAIWARNDVVRDNASTSYMPY